MSRAGPGKTIRPSTHYRFADSAIVLCSGPVVQVQVKWTDLQFASRNVNEVTCEHCRLLISVARANHIELTYRDAAIYAIHKKMNEVSNEGPTSRDSRQASS